MGADEIRDSMGICNSMSILKELFDIFIDLVIESYQKFGIHIFTKWRFSTIHKIWNDLAKGVLHTRMDKFLSNLS